MSKLAKEDKFLDLSDYGRSLGSILANSLKNTRFTPIHVTFLFGICGLLAAFSIFKEYYILAGIFLILKSIIDAADGELARLKKTPSYSGRYLDSLFDIILNSIFFLVICYKTDSNYLLALIAFFCCQLQGTLYNFYYVILRNKSIGGDTTSQIFENKIPKALPGEKQNTVKILFICYLIFYGIFDKIIQFMDKKAHLVLKLPNWFMTFLSIYGLGFQLLLIAFLLVFNLIDLIIPFFIFYSIFLIILIGIRKFLLK